MRPLPTGIYTPLPCFFHENEDIDIEALQSHVKFIASAGTIPVVSGSMGEAIHLNREEKKTIIRSARVALDEVNLHDVPIVAGAGGASTRESIELCKDAAEAGADYVMVIPPGYYAGALLADTSSIKKFFVDIAEASPLPVIIYNFPAVSGGIDMDSDLIVQIIQSSANICGVKLTCANVGKLTRIMAQVSRPEFQAAFPRSSATPFRAIDGFIDFLLPSISVGSAGAISGLPNIAPKSCVKLWNLCQDSGSSKQATELQNLIALADGVALKIGIAGMKKLLHRHFGYGDRPRLPLLPMDDKVADAVLSNAFSFYIGPTGVTDIHILSHQQYNDQNVSLPKVNGLKYRIMDNPGQKEMATVDFSPPTVFGITDHSLLEKAEPKLDPQLTENGWPRLWAMMDPTAAWHLIKLYSRYIDPYFPILSSHQIPSSSAELNKMPLALLTAICATALPFVMYDDSLYTMLLNPPSSEKLYRLCWLCISQELHAPSLATLQACLLLQQRLPTNMYLSDTAFAWTLMATSLAVAQTIGLHRDAGSWTSIPAWEKRLRRRLWWGLYAMEKWVALARGMPSHLGDDDYDVSMLKADDIQDTLSDSPDTQSHIYHLSNLSTILSDIQRSFYSVKAIGKTSNDLQYSLDLARPMRVRLKDWRDNLPSNLRPVSNAVISGEDLDGNGSLYLSYIVTHVALLRALLRPLDRWPAIIKVNKEEPEATYEGAKAVVTGALLCVKEFVEFVERLTGAQWNAFWHSWSRPNFAIAGSFMVHLLQIVTPPNQTDSQSMPELLKYSFEKEHTELQDWIRRWRWATRISANGAAGVKGLTNLGFIKVETLIGNGT
ncbi:hypothetical protein LT330_006814 [Penicillium expansum]|nr:hypothetical protein LT330_006814 [Penicillium expansum]